MSSWSNASVKSERECVETTAQEKKIIEGVFCNDELRGTPECPIKTGIS